MSWLIGIAVVSTLLAMLFFGRTVRCTRRGRLVRAGGSGLGCIACSGLAGASIVLLFSYFSYERLTAETTVSTVQFRALGPDRYEARMMLPDRPDRLFELRGDEWQVDARLILWKPPMTILGLEPLYRLERLSGRYSEIGREQSEVRTVHALTGELPVDLWRMARRYPVLPGVDAYYGTATYVPMADGARFDVQLTRDALIARPANDVARNAVGNWDRR